MRSAIERAVVARALDRGVVVFAHGRCREKSLVGGRRHFAVGVVSGVELHDHELLGLVIAGTIDEAAARDLGARKGLEVQLAVILHIHGLGSGPGGAGKRRADEQDKSKHGKFRCSRRS